MNTAVTFHGVLAGAYRGKDVGERALLNHASLDGSNAICGKVRAYGLCDEIEPDLTCPVCQAKLSRIRAKEYSAAKK